MSGTTITRESFGRHADRVEEHMGEYTLPISDEMEIHPGHRGGWVVVGTRTGQVSSTFSDLDAAVAFAEAAR